MAGASLDGEINCRPIEAAKIANNRKRDRRNFRRLRLDRWSVIRLWEHQIKSDPDFVPGAD